MQSFKLALFVPQRQLSLALLLRSLRRRVFLIYTLVLNIQEIMKLRTQYARLVFPVSYSSRAGYTRSCIIRALELSLFGICLTNEVQVHARDLLLVFYMRCDEYSLAQASLDFLVLHCVYIYI